MMTLKQYAIALQLARKYPDDCIRAGMLLEFRWGNEQPSYYRVNDPADATDYLYRGYAPDLSDSSCVGPLLELAARVLPIYVVLEQFDDDYWCVRADRYAWGEEYGDSPGHALAKLILELPEDSV